MDGSVDPNSWTVIGASGHSDGHFERVALCDFPELDLALNRLTRLYVEVPDPHFAHSSTPARLNSAL